MKKFFRNNGLSLVMFSLFLVFIVVQFFVGHAEFNEELRRHSRVPFSYGEYLQSGHAPHSMTEG